MKRLGEPDELRVISFMLNASRDNGAEIYVNGGQHV